MTGDVTPEPTKRSEDLTQNPPTAETGKAPPFPGQVAGGNHSSAPFLGLPPCGHQLRDFELHRILGTGGIARVYLARQVSLDRLVALKVSRNKGQEARTLAGLEHDHIVRVFSEDVDPDRDLHLMCMQYVAGTTLDTVIAELKRLPAGERTGERILEVIHCKAEGVTTLDLGAVRDLEAMASMDLVEAVCWMGARLAEALDHAHRHSILHRDIKPANILVNRYGRPLLADFNISVGEAEKGQPLGGTPPYMAPEHLEAMQGKVPPQRVDARSDIWALGAVLYEFLTSDSPYPTERWDTVQTLCERRQLPPPRLTPRVPASPALERVLARCLAPDPQDRYQSAADLAVDLDSCLELKRVEVDLPQGRVVTRLSLQAPFWVGTFLILFPHIAATPVNIEYNREHIVRFLSQAQNALFWNQLIPIYNSIAYVICLTIVIVQTRPVYHVWKSLAEGGPVDASTVDAARRRALLLPKWVALVACIGWMAGGVVFPTVLSLWPPPLEPLAFWHFVFSFTISGLIAVTYSVLGCLFVVVRVIYPALWLDARKLRETAQRELAPVEGWIGSLQFCAVLIPLAGAALMIRQQEDSGLFRLLVTSLLGLGMVGLGLALLAGSELRQAVAALTRSPGGKRRC